MKVIIIGGGASGLMCALTFAKKGNAVTIIESGFKVGKKILVSGNGRCNLTNGKFDKTCYNTDINNFFRRFDNLKTLQFFKSIGLETYHDEENRYYPISNNSTSVLDVLLNNLKLYDCNFVTNCTVKDIVVGDKFLVIADNKKFTADKVVIATGGKSMTEILDKLKINYVPYVKSLCGLICSEDTRSISGVRHKAGLSVKDTNLSEVGEVIFKDNGISGICVFNLSARLNWLKAKNPIVNINLLPDINNSDLEDILLERVNKLGRLRVENFLDGYFVHKLGEYLMELAKIDRNKFVKDITKNQISSLVKMIQNLEFKVINFDTNNQVSCGGVSLDDLSDTLESKKYKGLYFCGEVVNVDGICGGYNLQWAWTSGHIVGDNL